MYYEKFRAIAELYIVKRFKIRAFFIACYLGSILLRRGNVFINFLAVYNHLKAAKYGNKALAAGIHNARFLKHRQKLRREQQRTLAFVYHNVYKLIKVCTLVRFLGNGFRHHARNSKHCAFLGLHNGLIRSLGPGSERSGKVFRRHFFFA